MPERTDKKMQEVLDPTLTWNTEVKEKNLDENRRSGAFEKAVIDCFSELEEAGVLDPVSKAKKAGLIKAAAACDRGLAYSTTSVATSTMFKTVMEALNDLPTVAAASESGIDALAETLSTLTNKVLDGLKK